MCLRLTAAYWDVMVNAEHAGRLNNFSTSGTDDELPEPVSDEKEPALPLPPSCAYH